MKPGRVFFGNLFAFLRKTVSTDKRFETLNFSARLSR